MEVRKNQKTNRHQARRPDRNRELTDFISVEEASSGDSGPTERQRGYLSHLCRVVGLKLDVSKIDDARVAVLVRNLELMVRRIR